MCCHSTRTMSHSIKTMSSLALWLLLVVFRQTSAEIPAEILLLLLSFKSVHIVIVNWWGMVSQFVVTAVTSDHGQSGLNNKWIFPMGLEAGSTRSGYLQIFWPVTAQLQTCQRLPGFLLGMHVAKWKLGSFELASVLIECMRASSSELKYL